MSTRPDVGRQQRIRSRQQRGIRGQGLRFRHIESGPAKGLRCQGPNQGRVVHHRPACGIDQQRTRFEPGQAVVIDQVPRLVGQGNVQADDVGLAI